MYASVDLRGAEARLQHIRAHHGCPAPVVVGGVGGSGTRLVVQLLCDLGVAMGMHCNAAGDAMPFVPVYENHINAYLGGRLQPEDFANALLEAIKAHRGNNGASAIWGWKNPRSIYLLPLLDAIFKDMVFIHVVRDGMAMATSANQAQLTKHGPYLIPEHLRSLPAAERSLLLWSIVNGAAADYGQHMHKRYLRLRYEDICDDPSAALAGIASMLGVNHGGPCSVKIEPIRKRDPNTRLPGTSGAGGIARAALQRFGYPC